MVGCKGCAPTKEPQTARALVIRSAIGSSTSPNQNVDSAPSGSSTSAEVRYLPDFVPATEAEMAACLRDPEWRICSGHLCATQVAVS